MNVYETPAIASRLAGKEYVGRGIALGLTADGKKAVSAYFIMGRSQNSRNRIFTLRDGALFTEPYRPELVEDPSLIIYAALRQEKNQLIVTNGDQTDTILSFLQRGESFSASLRTRAFEPDAPNFTPRISGLWNLSEKDPTYEMSILKSADEAGSACSRFFFEYPALPGTGHFIHTYVDNGTPIPTFQGEPERIAIPSDPQEFAAQIWEGLNEDNRISLYVRYTDLSTLAFSDCLINRNK